MKKRILIYGKVHNVGYRPFLLGIAGSLGINRFYADNVFREGREAIEILIEADKESIDNFTEILKSRKPERAEVEDIEILDYDGGIMDIESYYRYLTTLQLFTIATYGGYMLDKQDSMLGKQGKMLEKQDKMLEKQDKMLGKMDEMLEKQDLMLQKQDETIREIRALREDLKAYMDERFKRIEEEIKIIKEKLGLL
jgi:acylphosphatase